jgi:quinol monooxygenase YgiN
LVDPCWDVRTLRVDVGFLVEAFRDGDAGAEHVDSEHFKAAQRELPQALASTPKLAEITVD